MHGFKADSKHLSHVMYDVDRLMKNVRSIATLFSAFTGRLSCITLIFTFLEPDFTVYWNMFIIGGFFHLLR